MSNSLSTTAPNESSEKVRSDSPEATTKPDYVNDERIRVLRKSLADVKKPASLKHRTGRNLLAHAELTLDILDAVHDLHPFIGVVTIPFKATLKIVLIKQDNDKRVAALMLEMIDMMSALIELRNIKEQDRETSTGETVQDNLTRVLKSIKIDIEEVGNVVDCYVKARTWHRVVRARDWLDQFKDFADRFQRGKANIQMALSLRTTLEVDALHPKVDHVLLLMQEWFLRPMSLEERRLLDIVRRQGTQNILESELKFRKLYQDNPLADRARETGGAMSDKRGSDDSKERDKESREQWEELKEPLANLLAHNHSIFEAKLEVQKRDLTSVIWQSETTIIRAINDGPHSYIKHPVIRDLWQAMNWRLSIKTRHFVMALHDHYLHGLSYTGASQGIVTLDHAAGSPTAPNPAALVDPADRWCLQYLRIRHLPAISEAFDDDGSGFIKIGEVNDFTAGIPKGWTLLQWVAYWTAGWPKESAKYSNRIQQTLVQIAEAQLHVKPENIKDVNGYMNSLAISEIQLVVSSIQSLDISVDSELARLTISYRLQMEKIIGENLEIVKYNIDDPGSLSVICGPGRVEKYLFPLLHLMLLRHLEIVRFASDVVLDSREMQAAQDSLYNVMEKVWIRMTELKESFRQQKLDVNESFKHFACGIYSRYHYSNALTGIGFTPKLPDLSDSLSDSESFDEPYGTVMEPAIDPLGPDSAPSKLFGSSDTQDKKPVTSLSDDHIEAELPDRSIVPKPGTPANNSKVMPIATETEERLPASESSANKQTEPPKKSRYLTRYRPLTLDTYRYAESPNLTGVSLAWRSLGVKISAVGPRKMFRLAIQRVLERVRLLSPRLTWAYLQRRREIRLKWLEVSLRSEDIYLGDDKYENREPSNQQELASLSLQINPADVSYYTSLANMEVRRRAIHSGIFCVGCRVEIFGKLFHCIDCPDDFDLCDVCERTEFQTYGTNAHLPSHTMMEVPYPLDYYGMFDQRAQKYMMKHAKQLCPCSDIGGQGSSPVALTCGSCRKALRNEVHFRCLQCPDYDLCGPCEQSSPSGHCIAHVLLKLKAPFINKIPDGSDDDDEEQPLSVEARLTQLAKRINDLETKFDSRLDELQRGFTRVITLLELTAKQRIGEMGS